MTGGWPWIPSLRDPGGLAVFSPCPHERLTAARGLGACPRGAAEDEIPGACGAAGIPHLVALPEAAAWVAHRPFTTLNGPRQPTERQVFTRKQKSPTPNCIGP